MTTVSKIITMLIMGALLVLVITHPAGFSADAVAGGSVLNNTLALESGQGVGAGTAGTFNLGPGKSFSVG